MANISGIYVWIRGAAPCAMEGEGGGVWGERERETEEMQSCLLAAATGLKKGEKGHHWREGVFFCQKKNVDQPGKVKGPGQRETKVMMMS